MDIGIRDIDWRSLLVKRYKNYGIDENDLSVLLVLNEVLSNFDFLVTAEDLVMYMTLSKPVIDNCLVKLMDKKLIDYVTKDGKLVTSLEPLFKRLFNDLKKDIVLDSKDSSKEKIKPLVNNLYNYFEELMGKPLSAREVDRISTWIQSGADERLIHEAVEKLKAKGKNISIPAVDKILLNLQKSQDISREGFSPRNDEWREGSEETMMKATSPWVPHE